MQNDKFQSSEVALHAEDYWRVLKNRYGIILVTFILAVLAAFVFASLKQKKYESTARVEIKAEDVDIKSRHISRVGSAGNQFFSTEFKVIESEKTLALAAQMGDFSADWNGMPLDEVVDVFKQSIDVKEIRGSHMVDITMTHTDKRDAKKMVEYVYLAYAERRRKENQKRYERARVKYQDRLKEASDQVEELRKKRTELAQQYGEPEVKEGYRSPEDEIYRNELRQVQELTVSLTTLTQQAERLSGLSDDKLISAVVALKLQGSAALVSQLNERYTDVKRSKQALIASGLGRNHPEVKTANASIVEIENELNERCKDIRDNLQTELAQVKDLLQEREEKLKEADKERLIAAGKYEELNAISIDYKNALNELLQMKNVELDEETAYLLISSPIDVHQEPRVAKTHASPRMEIFLSVGAVFGLMFGLGIAFMLELMDTSVKTLEDVERYLQVPVLAVVPKDVGVLHQQNGASPDAEAYRILRTNIEFNRKNPDDNCITVVSGGAGEGKSTTMVNLAYICAQGGYSTLMIDADLRRPRMHTFFDINNSVGLTNYLTTDLALEDVIFQTSIDNLFFMPSGILPADAAGILNSRRMSELIQDVKARFDLVLIDSPPILGVSDASVLASEVDLTMIVVQHRKLPREMLQRVKGAVENVGGHVLGVVLNNVDVRSDSNYQYYTSYYTYYSPTSAPANQSAGAVTQNTAPSDKDNLF